MLQSSGFFFFSFVFLADLADGFENHALTLNSVFLFFLDAEENDVCVVVKTVVIGGCFLPHKAGPGGNKKGYSGGKNG